MSYRMMEITVTFPKMRRILNGAILAIFSLFLSLQPSKAHTLFDRGNCTYCFGTGECRPTAKDGASTYKYYCNGSGICGVCNGTRVTSVDGYSQTCPTCSGSGKCKRCHGTGKCSHCHGTGYSGKVEQSSSSGHVNTGADENSQSAFSDIGSYASNLSPIGLVIGAAVAISLSYGVFGYLAIRNWKNFSYEYPNLQVRAGYSLAYGINVAAKAHWGGTGGLTVKTGIGTRFWTGTGFTAYGHVGFYLCPDRKSDISWTLGVGYVGKSYSAYPSTEVEYTRFFGIEQQHGITAGLGIGYCREKMNGRGSAMPEFHVGYTFKLPETLSPWR